MDFYSFKKQRETKKGGQKDIGLTLVSKLDAMSSIGVLMYVKKNIQQDSKNLQQLKSRQ